MKPLPAVLVFAQPCCFDLGLSDRALTVGDSGETSHPEMGTKHNMHDVFDTPRLTFGIANEYMYMYMYTVNATRFMAVPCILHHLLAFAASFTAVGGRGSLSQGGKRQTGSLG